MTHPQLGTYVREILTRELNNLNEVIDDGETSIEDRERYVVQLKASLRAMVERRDEIQALLEADDKVESL